MYCYPCPTQTAKPSFFRVSAPSFVTRCINWLGKVSLQRHHLYAWTNFVSHIFPSQEGWVLLKRFDEVVSHYHFKMDSLSTITKLVTKNCFKAALDLKDAYYSIPIRSLDRKFLLFIREGTLYEFTCHPNGLSCAPRIFSKFLRPPLSSLHKQGHIAVAHLDDLYL